VPSGIVTSPRRPTATIFSPAMSTTPSWMGAPS
jgi:hypothetical protein